MTNATACCPTCQVFSTRVHSRYHRHIADLPWAGYPVALVIQVRRFRCQSTDCVQRIFCERLSPAIATYARQTERLQEQWRTLALAMGGELTTRVLPHLGMQSSPATLLVRLRALPLPERKPVRVLGIDDWAKRKGHVYALQRMLDRFAPTLRQATELAAAPSVQPSSSADEKDPPAVPEQAPPPTQPEAVPPSATLTPQAPSRTAMNFQTVKELKQQGMSDRAIAQQLGLNRRTVRRYSVHETVPVRTSMPHPPSILLPFVDYLQRRLQEGCDNRTQLHQELTALGFTGSYHTVWRATQQLLPLAQAQQPAPPPPVRPLSSRQAAWLLVRRSDELKPEEKQLLAALCGSSEPIATAHQLTQAFYRLVRQRKADEFDPWLASAQQADIPELKRFAEGLAQDYLLPSRRSHWRMANQIRPAPQHPFIRWHK